jgi:hypothetical protein
MTMNLQPGQIDILKPLYYAGNEGLKIVDCFNKVKDAFEDRQDFDAHLDKLVFMGYVAPRLDYLFISDKGREVLEAIFPWLNILTFVKLNDQEFFKVQNLNAKVLLLQSLSNFMRDDVKRALLEIAEDLKNAR